LGFLFETVDSIRVVRTTKSAFNSRYLGFLFETKMLAALAGRKFLEKRREASEG